MDPRFGTESYYPPPMGRASNILSAQNEVLKYEIVHFEDRIVNHARLELLGRIVCKIMYCK